MRLPSAFSFLPEQDGETLLREAVERGQAGCLRAGNQTCGEFLIHSGQLREELYRVFRATAGNWETAGVFIAALKSSLPPLRFRVVTDLGDRNALRDFRAQIRPRSRELYGYPEQKAAYLEAMITGAHRIAFGLTEPAHGSDATWMEATARPEGGQWVINGTKRFNTGLHTATVDLIFARTSGEAGDARDITAFLVPTDTPGFRVEHMWWTFNMPSDHAEVTLSDVRVPDSTVLGRVGEGLVVAQHFVHENRIRQAASSLGAAQFCIDESIAYARRRRTWGKPLAVNQAIQFPLTELATEAEMVRGLVYKTAWHLDRRHHMSVSRWLSMANYRANRLVCQAADTAIQVHGGIGYTRHRPFEHIFRHHRRYRITEGSEEIQIRRIAGPLFGFISAG